MFQLDLFYMFLLHVKVTTDHLSMLLIAMKGELPEGYYCCVLSFLPKGAGLGRRTVAPVLVIL